MRDSRSYGSVRGALRERRPYRNSALRCTNRAISRSSDFPISRTCFGLQFLHSTKELQ
jgi:hypothetical protein